MKKVMGWTLWIAGAVMVLAVGLPLIWGWAMKADDEDTPARARSRPGLAAAAMPETDVQDRVLVLILGVDSWGKLEGAGAKDGATGYRTDTMIVGSLDPKRRSLSLVSIPRDTRVRIPGHGYDKISHAYAFGGHELAVQSVSGLLDLPISHYVVVNLGGFEKIVDAVGGIEINVPKRMKYSDPYQDLYIDLYPGIQLMSGEKALHYARFRSDAESDWGRMHRQQEVIQLVLQKATRPGYALRIPGLVQTAFGAVRTDLSLGQSLQFANVVRQLAGRELEAATLSGEDLWLLGGYYMVPDIQQVRSLAYGVLVGGEPPAAYVERARAAADDYRTALNAAVENDRAKRAALPAPGDSAADAAAGASGISAEEELPTPENPIPGDTDTPEEPAEQVETDPPDSGDAVHPDGEPAKPDTAPHPDPNHPESLDWLFPTDSNN